MIEYNTLTDADRRIARDYEVEWAGRLSNGDLVFIKALVYHVAVYVNPDGMGGCENRYCLSNKQLAVKAILEYEETGVMRYWQKWHNRNLSVVGTHLYGPDVPHLPEYAQGEVDWDTDELSHRYPHNPLLPSLLGG